MYKLKFDCYWITNNYGHLYKITPAGYFKDKNNKCNYYNKFYTFIKIWSNIACAKHNDIYWIIMDNLWKERQKNLNNIKNILHNKYVYNKKLFNKNNNSNNFVATALKNGNNEYGLLHINQNESTKPKMARIMLLLDGILLDTIQENSRVNNAIIDKYHYSIFNYYLLGKRIFILQKISKYKNILKIYEYFIKKTITRYNNYVLNTTSAKIKNNIKQLFSPYRLLNLKKFSRIYYRNAYRFYLFVTNEYKRIKYIKIMNRDILIEYYIYIEAILLKNNRVGNNGSIITKLDKLWWKNNNYDNNYDSNVALHAAASAATSNNIDQNNIILLTVNNGFYDFFINWLNFYKTLNIYNKYQIHIIADDNQVYNKLLLLKLLNVHVRRSHIDTSHDSAYNSKQYLKMVSTRPEHILIYLYKGINVLYADVDRYVFIFLS